MSLPLPLDPSSYSTVGLRTTTSTASHGHFAEMRTARRTSTYKQTCSLQYIAYFHKLNVHYLEPSQAGPVQSFVLNSGPFLTRRTAACGRTACVEAAS